MPEPPVDINFNCVRCGHGVSLSEVYAERLVDKNMKKRYEDIIKRFGKLIQDMDNYLIKETKTSFLTGVREETLTLLKFALKHLENKAWMEDK